MDPPSSGAAVGLKSNPTQGTCHKCAAPLGRGNRATARCPRCGLTYHTTDCGQRYANTGLDKKVSLEDCPKVRSTPERFFHPHPWSPFLHLDTSLLLTLLVRRIRLAVQQPVPLRGRSRVVPRRQAQVQKEGWERRRRQGRGYGCGYRRRRHERAQRVGSGLRRHRHR